MILYDFYISFWIFLIKCYGKNEICELKWSGWCLNQANSWQRDDPNRWYLFLQPLFEKSLAIQNLAWRSLFIGEVSIPCVCFSCPAHARLVHSVWSVKGHLLIFMSNKNDIVHARSSLCDHYKIINCKFNGCSSASL